MGEVGAKAKPQQGKLIQGQLVRGVGYFFLFFIFIFGCLLIFDDQD